jgi:hypothetical protein
LSAAHSPMLNFMLNLLDAKLAKELNLVGEPSLYSDRDPIKFSGIENCLDLS